MRVRLRAMLRRWQAPGISFARGNAAAMLGAFSRLAELQYAPLLTAALDRKLAATAGPSRAHGDPIARRACLWGLATIGGDRCARGALARAG